MSKARPASARTWTESIRCRARPAPAVTTRSFRSRSWRRGRYAGRCLLRRLSHGPGRSHRSPAARETLTSGPIRVRMGLHTGTPVLSDEGYVGVDVHRAARVAALAHGGQIVASPATVALLDGEAIRDLGLHRLKDFDAGTRLYQIGVGDFPPLRTPGSVDLPIPATRFLGREHELFAAISLVYERDPRRADHPRSGRNGQDAVRDRALPFARRRGGRRNGLRTARGTARPGTRLAGDCRTARSRLGRRCRGRRPCGRPAYPRRWSTTPSTCSQGPPVLSPSSRQPFLLCASSSRAGRRCASRARLNSTFRRSSATRRWRCSASERRRCGPNSVQRKQSRNSASAWIASRSLSSSRQQGRSC